MTLIYTSQTGYYGFSRGENILKMKVETQRVMEQQAIVENVFHLFSWPPQFCKLSLIALNKTEVTSVKLVVFKYVKSFETLSKVDHQTEIVRFGYVSLKIF